MGYFEVDGRLEDVIEIQPVLFQQSLQVLHGLPCLLLHIVRDELHGLGIESDIAGDIHDSVVDPGAGVGSDGLGSEEGVDGLDELSHEDMNDLIISYVSF